MEKSMNNILNDVNELRDLILDSREYKSYKKSLEKLDKHEEIKKMINKIVSLQKKIVKDESKNIDVKNLNIELDNMYKELYDNKIYSDYIDSSKKLNILITNIQQNFNEYFNSLVS